MGSVLSSIAGAKNNFQAQQPLGWDYEQNQINNQNQIYQNQNSLGQALQAQMNGTGPNPAQTQFLNNQQNNIANAQGLIASQRGLNPALAARLGSNAAATSNQQGAMGAALLQQQQQLAAQQQLQGLYGQQQQGNLAAQNMYTQGVQNAQGINAGVSQGNAQTNGQLFGGLVNGIAGAGAALATGGASAAVGAGAAGGSSAIPSADSLNMPTMSYHAQGGRIDGTPAEGPDSKANDNVPIMAQAGEIIIPNSKAHDPEKAKGFIDHLLKNEKKSKTTYGDVLKARRKSK